MVRNLLCLVIIFCGSLKAQQMNALNFDGVNDYVTINSLSTPLASASNFTIEFWVRADYTLNTSSVRVNLLAINGPASTTDNKFSIIIGSFSPSAQTGQLTIYEAGGSTTYITSTAVIGDNNCHHVAYVRSGSMGEAFIDGISIGTIPAGTAFSSADRISLGQEWDNLSASDFFNGEIDELQIWNVAKSASQIQTDMNIGLSGDESGLIAYYNFNEGTGGGNNTSNTTLIDLSSNNYDGSLVNFTLTGNSSNWVSRNCNNLTGLKQIINENGFTIYPNPFPDAATLNFENNLIDAQLQIYNAFGQKVKEIKNISGNTIYINRDKLSAGLYFIRLIKHGNSSLLGKVIIEDN